MKGIILAGGAGTRLHPITKVVSKQLLPVYDKPMIYYPLSVLMLAGIREILIISTPEDLPNFQKLFGDGSQLGLTFSYAEQPKPEGLAQAFIIGEEFIGDDDVCLVLGDNIFYGAGLQKLLTESVKTVKEENKAVIFGYYVDDPERYGVVAFDSSGKAYSIEENPAKPLSNFAVPGIYFYDSKVTEYALNLKPSPRGEIEITDINKLYMNEKKLFVEILGRGVAWLDAGKHEALLQASTFVQTVQERQGMMISCPEEIAFRKGFIDLDQLVSLAKQYEGNGYGQYLLELSKEFSPQ